MAYMIQACDEFEADDDADLECDACDRDQGDTKLCSTQWGNLDLCPNCSSERLRVAHGHMSLAEFRREMRNEEE